MSERVKGYCCSSSDIELCRGMYGGKLTRLLRSDKAVDEVHNHVWVRRRTCGIEVDRIVADEAKWEGRVYRRGQRGREDRDYAQLSVSYGAHGRSPLSVLPSHGRSSSSSPLHPFASHDMATSSEVSTAMRGDRLWVIESGGEGIFLPSLPFR